MGDRSLVDLYEANQVAQRVDKDDWRDEYDAVTLDSLKTKSWGSSQYDSIGDTGSGIWAPEKRAVVEMHNLKNLFYSEVWVYIVCDLYAKKIARQPITVAKEQFTNGKRSFKAVDDHPLLKSFRRPNNWENYRAFMTRVVAELMLMGNAVIWQMKYSKGMMLLPSELIQLDFDQRTRLKNYRFMGTNLSEDIQLPGVNRADFLFRPSEAIHIKLPNLNSMLWGLSPFVPGRKSVLFDRYSTEYLLNFYWNQGNAGMILEMDKEANESNAVRLIKSYENALTGRRNSRRTMLLPKGVHAADVQQHMSDQQFVDNVKMRREEIIALLHVPPHEVGLNVGGSLGSEETKRALENFWEAGLIPVQELIADALTEGWRRTGDLAPDEEIQFDNSDVKILQENLTEKAAMATAMLTTKTINEVRLQVWEDKPLEGGDVLQVEFAAAIAQKYAVPQWGAGGDKPAEEAAPAQVGEDGKPLELPPAGQDAPTSDPELEDPALEPEADAETEKTKEAAPRRVATVAMFHGDRILMGERNDNGRWTCPGGHLNDGEEPLAGACREFKEETGIDLDPAQLQPAGEPKEVVNEKGEKLTIYPFRLDVEERPAMTASQDPDGEVKRWGWVNTESGLPKSIKDNLHVPLKKNVLFEAVSLKGSRGFIRSNKSWYEKRTKAADKKTSDAEKKVLDSTLELFANFAAAAVRLASDKSKKKTKAKGGPVRSPAPNLSLEFLRELQKNNYISPGGQEYVASEVDALVAARAEAILGGKDSGGQEEAYGEQEGMDDAWAALEANDNSSEMEAMPRRAAIRRELDKAFDSFQEQWVGDNVRTLTNTVEFGYGLQLQTPFNIPNKEEIEALRQRNSEDRREVLASRLIRSFDQISETTTNDIMGIIADGLEQSQSLDQIRRAIVAKIANIDNAGYRAERIARTEALTAVSLGQYAAFKDVAEVIPGMELMWMTAGDSRVRDSHADLDGDRVKSGGKFNNGLMFPRDPAGSADETINCRCTFLMLPPDHDSLDDSGIEWTLKQ